MAIGAVFNRRVGVRSHNFIELASDYASAGRHDRAIEVLAHYANLVGQQVDTPLVYYYVADFHDQVGKTLVAKNFTAIGRRCIGMDFFLTVVKIW